MTTTVHLVPANDVIEHEAEECVCGPRTDVICICLDHGTFSYVVVHFSLDSSELAEQEWP